MKTETKVDVNTKARQIAFVMVCLLMVSVGLAGKVALDGLDRTQDLVLQDFMQPSQVYVQRAAVRHKTAVVAVKPAAKHEVKEVAPPALPVE